MDTVRLMFTSWFSRIQIIIQYETLPEASLERAAGPVLSELL